jgi:hypothetical protein
MSKNICTLMLLAISIHLGGCDRVTKSENDAKKPDSLLPREVTGKIASRLLDTILYTTEVQKYVDSVEKNLSGLVETRMNVFGSSAEGGQISVYRRGTDTLKLKAVYYGETGRNVYEFYSRTNKLVFFLEKAASYKSPIGKNPVKIDQESSRSFVFYGDEVVLGKQGKRGIPKVEYNIKSADIKAVYYQLKLELRE